MSRDLQSTDRLLKYMKVTNLHKQGNRKSKASGSKEKGWAVLGNAQDKATEGQEIATIIAMHRNTQQTLKQDNCSRLSWGQGTAQLCLKPPVNHTSHPDTS